LPLVAIAIDQYVTANTVESSHPLAKEFYVGAVDKGLGINDLETLLLRDEGNAQIIPAISTKI